MGKDGGFLTTKAISKKIKAKGLGKLRWYCQMCEKQCRDENGFKCHTQSTGHQRQIALFSENPTQYISEFSDQFQKEFLSVLHRRYGTKSVLANTVYQDYIKDRDHIHMNATKWTTLSDFVKELGKSGQCTVEDKEDGWWVSFLDREVTEKSKLAREIDAQRREEERRADMLLQRQIAEAKQMPTIVQSNDLVDYQPTGPISLQIDVNHRNLGKEKSSNPLASLKTNQDSFMKGLESSTTNVRRRRKSRWDTKPSMPTIEELRNDSIRESQTLPLQVGGISEFGKNENNPTTAADKPWLLTGIVVKVKSKTVGDGSFFGQKGQIVKVLDEFGAHVQMKDSGTILELDQDDLETVIPKPGGAVRMLLGKHRGSRAIVQSLNFEEYKATVTLDDNGETLQVEYEEISRVV